MPISCIWLPLYKINLTNTCSSERQKRKPWSWVGYWVSYSCMQNICKDKSLKFETVIAFPVTACYVGINISLPKDLIFLNFYWLWNEIEMLWEYKYQNEKRSHFSITWSSSITSSLGLVIASSNSLRKHAFAEEIRRMVTFCIKRKEKKNNVVTTRIIFAV